MHVLHSTSNKSVAEDVTLWQLQQLDSLHSLFLAYTLMHTMCKPLQIHSLPNGLGCSTAARTKYVQQKELFSSCSCSNGWLLR